MCQKQGEDWRKRSLFLLWLKLFSWLATGFGIGCGFGIGWGFGGAPLQTLGLGAGGGCGVGLGLGWGFGSAYGTRYLDSKLKFQAIDFEKVKTVAASQQSVHTTQKDS